MSVPEPAASVFQRLRLLSKSFWTLWASCCLIDFGLCLYFFMFSLFLVEHNVTVQNIGFITAALTTGTIAGTVFVPLLVKRFGLRRMMMVYIFCAPLCLASRAFFLQVPVQVGLAFFAGIAMSIWSVCFSPTLAKLTSHDNRTFGFSLFVATGIAAGAVGGLVGGYLPGFLHRVDPRGDGIKGVILMSCCMLMLAAFPIFRLRIRQDDPVSKSSRILTSFLIRFLTVAAVWNFALSFFVPFANVYLSRHLGLPLTHIGQIYTATQLVMVATTLLAPLLYRRVGLVRGIAMTQVVTALMLWSLSHATGLRSAVVLYFCLTAVQWMGGPGLTSLLMSRTVEGHRSQANAMHNMLNLAAQAGAAALAGKLFGRYGYSGPLAVNAILAAFSGVLLYVLLGRDGYAGSMDESNPSHVSTENVPASGAIA